MIIDQLFTRPLFEEEAMASPEQLAYNKLRAQWDGYQTMTGGGGNTAVSRDPAHAAKLATVPAEIARMAAALKAKGIDAEAQYDALSGPAAAPVDANQAYGLSENKSDPITQFASNAHEEWRRNFDPTGTKPRIKKNSDGTEGDINVPFEKLHPDWKKENLAAGHAAHHAVKHFGRDMEKAAEHVHNEWMKRNPKADYNAAQHVPYDDLSDDEKEKDRVHVRTMMRLMGHQPKQGIEEAGNANSGRRGPNSSPDNTPVKHGRVEKIKSGIRHHADPSRYGGSEPEVDDDQLLGYQSRYRLHKAVTPDEVDEVAPPGAKAERMVKHIKQGYAKDSKLTPKEKGIAFATAWKAHNAGQVEEQGVAEGYTGRETKAGTWRVFKDGNAVAAAGPFKSADEATAWIKKHKQGITEMDKSEPSAGRDTGPRSGPDREAKPITAKKATKDMGDMLTRAVKDSHKKKDVKESDTLMLKLKRAMVKEGRVKELADDLKTMSDADFMKKYGKAKAAIRKDMTKLDEARTDYTPDEMADMLSGKRSQKQIDADAERTRGPNKAPPTKESKQSRAKRLNEKLATSDTLSRPAAVASSSGKAIDDPDIMGSLKSASTPKFDRFSKTGGEPELDFRAGLGNDETEIETNPRLAAEPNKYMQSWGGKFAVDTPDNRPAPGSAQWQYVINPDYKAEKEVQWIPSSEADSIASWKANNAGKSADWGPASIPAAGKSAAVGGSPKMRWNSQTRAQEKFDPRTGTWVPVPADVSGANPNIDAATRDRARAWAAQQNAPGAALAGAMRSSGNPVDTEKKKADWKTIYNLNKSIIGDNPNSIKPGMKLKMPDGSTYRVQPGDNLSKIAAGQINELSTNQLARYKTAAAKDAKQADQEGDFKRGDKRFHGIVQATKKQFDNDAKKVDESRAARRALMARIVNSR